MPPTRVAEMFDDAYLSASVNVSRNSFRGMMILAIVQCEI
jgi:hypothetical protein